MKVNTMNKENKRSISECFETVEKCWEAGQYEEAFKWYRLAAEQGDAVAQSNLGTCYFGGEGVEQDYGEAVKWFKKAAEQEQANAQYNLGLCYEKGFGVEQDYKEAVKFYILA